MSTWRQTSPTGRALLVGVLLTGLTTFMFLPLLAIHLTKEGYPFGVAGFVVGVLAFSSQLSSFLVGQLVDRFGFRAMTLVGLALRITGYSLLALEHPGDLWTVLAGVLAIGVGGACLGLSIKTQLMAEEGTGRRDMLALRATFVNVGVVAGPALGALAYPAGFHVILLCCIASHLLLGIRLSGGSTWNARPRQKTVEPTSPREETARLPVRAMAVLAILGACYWLVYSQMNATLPLVAEQLTGDEWAISVLFTVNGVIVIVCQYGLLRHILKNLTARLLISCGFLSFAAAYVVLVPAAGWWSLLVFVLPATLAEMLIGPGLDEAAVQMSPQARTGSALGVIAAAGSTGSLLGPSLGGWLFGRYGGNGIIWLVFVAMALAAAALTLAISERTTERV